MEHLHDTIMTFFMELASKHNYLDKSISVKVSEITNGGQLTI